jgi:GTP-binding protein HflX
VSGLSGEGIGTLIERIEEEFGRTLVDTELLLPYGEGARLAELHELAGDLEREDMAEGVRIRARLPASAAARYERFALSSDRA